MAKIKKIEEDIKRDKLIPEEMEALKDDAGLLSGEAKETYDQEYLAMKITGGIDEQRERAISERLQKTAEEEMAGFKKGLEELEQELRQILRENFDHFRINERRGIFIETTVGLNDGHKVWISIFRKPETDPLEYEVDIFYKAYSHTNSLASRHEHDLSKDKVLAMLREMPSTVEKIINEGKTVGDKERHLAEEKEEAGLARMIQVLEVVKTNTSVYLNNFFKSFKVSRISDRLSGDWIAFNVDLFDGTKIRGHLEPKEGRIADPEDSGCYELKLFHLNVNGGIEKSSKVLKKAQSKVMSEWLASQLPDEIKKFLSSPTTRGE